MRNWLIFSALLFLFGITTPVPAQNEKPKTKVEDLLKAPAKTPAGDAKDAKSDDKDVKKAPVKETKKEEKLVYGSKFVGKVKQTGKNGDLTVEVSQTYSVPNPSGFKTLQDRQRQAAQLQQRLAFERNPNTRNSLLRQLASLANQKPPTLYDVKTHKFDVTVKTGENLKVRAANPPFMYDDKGLPIQLTKEKLAELRGPEKLLPGFPTQMSSVKMNSVVEIYLAVPPKADPKADPKKGDPKKTTGATVDLLGGETPPPVNGIGGEPTIGGDPAAIDNRPEAVMIVILKE
jgi:hypothetical protein